MDSNRIESHHRILVVDASPPLHAHLRKLLMPASSKWPTALLAMKNSVFSAPKSTADTITGIDLALDHADGLALVKRACSAQRPYTIAFVGLQAEDALESIHQLWTYDPHLQLVLCTSGSDYPWNKIQLQFGSTDRLFILQTPIRDLELRQLVIALTHKWRAAQESRRFLMAQQQQIEDRTRDLKDCHMRLDAAQRQLALAMRHQQATLNTQARHQLAFEGELRHALESGELSVYYQPLVNIATGRLESLEALVRWNHPEKGQISPATFIPLAEETGLILPLGEFVLRTVCEQTVLWQREGVPVVPVAVNVSAIQLQSQHMWKLVRRILRETGMQPQHLALEITESALMKDAQGKIKHLHGLRRDGIAIELDDFGTGYSSLSHIKQLPIDTIKIDRSFIHQIDRNPQDEAIVKAILTMARSLNLKVVAEGVETETQLDILRQQGCEVAQGYFFSRPVPAQSCRDLLFSLAARPSFTETLRIRWNRASDMNLPASAALAMSK